MNRSLVSMLVGALAATTVAGCLFRTAEAPRFYRPASTMLDADDGTPTPAPAPGAAIRLHTVRSAPFLRERIVWRASPVEYGLYEQRRWFELPSRYVRRALTAALEDTPGLRLDENSAAARLDIEILAFDEVLAPTHQASVALAVTLREGTQKRLDRVYEAHAPIASADAADMAAAMGKALDDAVHKVARAAANELSPKPGAGTKTRRPK
jgi:ABC-type uncharacterized transport system auxiliary subunit